jgi:MFS family permease
MQADLHATAGAVEWVVDGYGLTFAMLLITAGRLGDQVGRRRMFSIGLGLFTVASAARDLAPSATALVAAQLVRAWPPRCSARRSCRSSASPTRAPTAWAR